MKIKNIQNELNSRFTIKKVTRETQTVEEEGWKKQEILRLKRMIEDFKDMKRLILDELNRIDDEYEIVKSKIYKYFAVVFIMVIIQPLFTGIMKSIMPLLFFVFSLIYFLKLLDECTMPIISYHIEHKSKIVQGYVIANSIVPLYDKLKELDVEIEYCVEQIVELKNDSLLDL